MSQYNSLEETAQFSAVSPRTEARQIRVTGEVEDLMANAAQRRQAAGAVPGEDDAPRTVLGDLKLYISETRAELQFRPFYTVAEGCIVGSILSTCIGICFPWVAITASDSIQDHSTGQGGIRLTAVHLCTITDGGRTATANARRCMTVELEDIATNVDYLRIAGGSAFAALVFALLFLTVAWAIVRGRRKESIDDSWLLQRIQYLRSHAVGAAVCCLASICLLIAWAGYHATISASWDGVVLASVLYRRGGSISRTIGGGLFFTGAAWAAAVCAFLVVLFYPEEPRSWREVKLPSLDLSRGEVSGGYAGQGSEQISNSGVFTGADTSAATFFASGATSTGKGGGPDVFSGLVGEGDNMGAHHDESHVTDL